MKKRVLIADNMPESIAPIRDFLERCGYSVLSAHSVSEARRAAAEGQPDVAIIDLRLSDQQSDSDFSGIELARSLDPRTPKIILTAFPSVKAVRAALGSAANGLSSTVAFLSKKEPMEMLLRTVKLALTPPQSELLRCFDTLSMQGLPERVRDLGPEVTAERIEAFVARQKSDCWRQVDLQTREAAEYHRMGMLASIVGFLVVLVAIALSLLGKTSSGVVTMAGSMVIHVVSALFSSRADKVHQRMEASLVESRELVKLGSLLELCACFENPDKRDQNREAVFNVFIDRVSRPAGAKSRANRASA
jgi:CheY-like chemotaxis protein